MTSTTHPTTDELDAELQAAADQHSEVETTALAVPQSHITGALLRELPHEAMDSVIRALLLQGESAIELRHRVFEAEERAAEAIEHRRWAEQDRDRLVTERAQMSGQLRDALIEVAAFKASEAENQEAVGTLSLAMGLLLELAPEDARVSNLLFRAARIGVGVKTPLLHSLPVTPAPQAVILPFPQKTSPALPADGDDHIED